MKAALSQEKLKELTELLTSRAVAYGYSKEEVSASGIFRTFEVNGRPGLRLTLYGKKFSVLVDAAQKVLKPRTRKGSPLVRPDLNRALELWEGMKALKAELERLGVHAEITLR